MLKTLRVIRDIIFESLEGTILLFRLFIRSLVRRFIPLVAEVVFLLTPFILAIYILYIKIGFIAACVGTVILAFLVITGLSYRSREGNNADKKPPDVYWYVVIIYILLLSIIFWDEEWFKEIKRIVSLKSEDKSIEKVEKGRKNLPETGEDISNLPEHERREAVYIKLLKDSISKSSDFETLQSLRELHWIRSKLVVPYAFKLLQDKYKSDNNRDIGIVKECFEILVEAREKNSCSLLYEIQIKSLGYREIAANAASQICVEAGR
jgi:hypothetical protein